MALGKLIGGKRSIYVYKRTETDILGEEVQEIPVDFIPLETLKSIVKPNDDDPLLYDGYPLEQDEIDKLNNFLENKITPDFNLFEYALECYGIYE